jgi:diaminohydroxyphosphoribosylaminopyrimidine deaminase/5-amino-6-(5-phosphoribosylamino)uracil reductase
LKVAASIDGAIAMKSGESQWITGPEAREDVQRLRARSGAVLTGIGTVLADDPSMNVRTGDLDSGGLQPLRVVLDSRLRMPVNAQMLALPGSTLVCCSGKLDSVPLQDAGAEVLSCADSGGAVHIGKVLEELARRDVNDVLVEAGPVVSGRMLRDKLVDELVIYQAPHIMGSETRRMFETPTWSALADRKALEIRDVRRIGKDTRITARVVN